MTKIETFYTAHKWMSTILLYIFTSKNIVHKLYIYIRTMSQKGLCFTTAYIYMSHHVSHNIVMTQLITLKIT